MEIVINGKPVKLNNKDVHVAQKLVNSFISSVKDNAVAHNKLAMYITTVVTMHTTSADILKSIDPDVMKILTEMGGDNNG